jgi:hypothetical protein
VGALNGAKNDCRRGRPNTSKPVQIIGLFYLNQTSQVLVDFSEKYVTPTGSNKQYIQDIFTDKLMKLTLYSLYPIESVVFDF